MTLVPPVKLDKEEYRLAHTLVFFRSGIGGWIKEQRENKIGSALAWLPSWTVPGNCHIRGSVTSEVHPHHTPGSAPNHCRELGNLPQGYSEMRSAPTAAGWARARWSYGPARHLPLPPRQQHPPVRAQAGLQGHPGDRRLYRHLQGQGGPGRNGAM